MASTTVGLPITCKRANLGSCSAMGVQGVNVAGSQHHEQLECFHCNVRYDEARSSLIMLKPHVASLHMDSL